MNNLDQPGEATDSASVAPAGISDPVPDHALVLSENDPDLFFKAFSSRAPQFQHSQGLRAAR